MRRDPQIAFSNDLPFCPQKGSNFSVFPRSFNRQGQNLDKVGKLLYLLCGSWRGRTQLRRATNEFSVAD